MDTKLEDMKLGLVKVQQTQTICARKKACHVFFVPICILPSHRLAPSVTLHEQTNLTSLQRTHSRKTIITFLPVSHRGGSLQL